MPDRQVRERADRERIVAGHAAPGPRLIWQLLEERAGGFANGAELLDEALPLDVVSARRVDGHVLVEARERRVEPACEPERTKDEETLTVIQVANDFAQRFGCLEEWARVRFPMIESFDYHWSGQVMESVDGLAYIGANPMDAPNVFIATGDCGMGMTHGTIAGILLTELIRGHDHPWKPLYDPSRITVRAIAEFT